MKHAIAFGLVALVFCGATLGGEEAKAGRFRHLFTVYSTLPAVTATAAPFAVRLPLGAGYEYLSVNGWGFGVTSEFNGWKDYLGVYGGINHIDAWTLTAFLARHFRGLFREVVDPYLGMGMGFMLISQSNELGNPGIAIRDSVVLRPFAGMVAYPFYGSPGGVRNLGLRLQVAWNILRHRSRLNLSLGLSFRY